MSTKRIYLAAFLVILMIVLGLSSFALSQQQPPETGQSQGQALRQGPGPGAGQGLRQGQGLGQGRAQQTPVQPLPTQNLFNFIFSPKLITMLVIAVVALILLLTGKMDNRVRLPILLVSTFLYGVSANLGLKIFSGFSMHPSPICAFTKPLLYGLRAPMLATLAVILLLSLIGPKLFCSYVCPVGAVQELLAMLADRLKIRRRRPAFRLSQTFRVLIFLAFIALSWTAVIHTVNQGQIRALSLYDYINAFEGFKWNLQPTLLDNLFHFLPLLLTLAFAFFTYRPYCYFVCPVGLFTNIIEQIAVFRVVKKKDSCNDCQACAAKAPCPAVAEILKDAVMVPDCFACTICTRGCSRGQLRFGLKDKAKEKEQPA
ncbi:MAG: 4Fe-4S binding protein [Candidatus Saccharicenans sp.]|uniref:4Fe-4S binding protein n=1 Tax=Candidatus Saccharicenans sp. TaxID=2819258 RepID=UPI0040494F12